MLRQAQIEERQEKYRRHCKMPPRSSSSESISLSSGSSSSTAQCRSRSRSRGGGRPDSRCRRVRERADVTSPGSAASVNCNFAEFYTTQAPGFQTVVGAGGYYPISSIGPVMNGGFTLTGANTVTVARGGPYDIRFTLFPTICNTHCAGIQVEVDGVRIGPGTAVARLLDAVTSLDTTLTNSTFAHLRDGATVRLLNNTDSAVVLRQINLVQLRFVPLPRS